MSNPNVINSNLFSSTSNDDEFDVYNTDSITWNPDIFDVQGSNENKETNNISNDRQETSSNDLNSEECTALVTLKERRLLGAQTMFKKSIKVSIKSFLISISLSFLNLFI